MLLAGFFRSIIVWFPCTSELAGWSFSW